MEREREGQRRKDRKRERGRVGIEGGSASLLRI